MQSSSSSSVSSATSSVLTHSSSILQSSSRLVLSGISETSSTVLSGISETSSTVLSGISETSSTVLSGISETSSTVLSSTSSNVVGMMDTVKSSSVPVTQVASSLSPTQSNSEVTTSTFIADHMIAEATSMRGAVIMTTQQDAMIGPSSTRISSSVSQTSSSLNIGVLPTPTPSYSSKATPSSWLSKPTGTGNSDVITSSGSKKLTTTSTVIPFPENTVVNTVRAFSEHSSCINSIIEAVCHISCYNVSSAL